MIKNGTDTTFKVEPDGEFRIYEITIGTRQVFNEQTESWEKEYDVVTYTVKGYKRLKHPPPKSGSTLKLLFTVKDLQHLNDAIYVGALTYKDKYDEVL